MNIFMLVLAVAASACSVADRAVSPEPRTAAAETATGRVLFEVKGIACQACAARVRTALQRLDGVSKVDVDVAQKIAAVDFDRMRTNATRIKAEIERLGFEARQLEDAATRTRAIHVAGGLEREGDPRVRRAAR